VSKRYSTDLDSSLQMWCGVHGYRVLCKCESYAFWETSQFIGLCHNICL